MKVNDLSQVLTDGSKTVTIHNIVNGNTQHLDALIDLYLGLMGDYENYVPHIRRVANRAPNADPRFVDHQWLAMVDGVAAGTTIFRYVPARNCGVGFALAVKKEFREYTLKGYDRFAHMLNRLSLEQLREDSVTMGKPIPVGLVVEAETPEAVDDPDKKRSRTNLMNRYSGYGYMPFPVVYLEPPDMYDSPNQAATDLALFDTMSVGIFPIEGSPFSVNDPDVIEECLAALLLDHYGLPADHPAYLKVIDGLKQK